MFLLSFARRSSTVCTFLFFLITSPSLFAGTLKVAVAANFHSTLTTLITQFNQQSTEQHTITAVSDSSGDLRVRAADDSQGFDLFLSADSSNPKALDDAGKTVSGSRQVYAKGQLAFWHGQQVQVTPSEIDSYIRDNQQTVSIADPDSAPYGLAAKQTLEKLGLYQTLKDNHKLLEHDNVQDSWEHIRDEDAQVGFIAKSLIVNEDIGSTDVPENLYSPINQELVILKRTQELELAQAFVTFLTSDAAQDTIAQNGYLKADSGPANSSNLATGSAALIVFSLLTLLFLSL